MQGKDNRAQPNGPQSTTSMDLPPSLARLIMAPVLQPQSAPMPPQMPGAPMGMNMVTPPPPQSYQLGGMVGPSGVPIRPQTAMPANAGMPQTPGLQEAGPAPMEDPMVLEAQVQEMIRTNPQVVQELVVEISTALQTGEAELSDFQIIGQMGTVALQNPQMYPQIRQYLIENDFLDEEDMPLDYVQGYALILHMIGKVAEQVAAGGQAAMPMAAPGGQMAMPMAAPGGQPQMPMAAPGGQPQMSMREGGPLPERSSKPDGSIPINAHEGEYVIPKHVVRAKGTEFFDKLLQQYNDRDDD